MSHLSRFAFVDLAVASRTRKAAWGSKPDTRICSDSAPDLATLSQDLRLRETLWKYARNRVTELASFCRVNQVSFSRAPQVGVGYFRRSA